MNSLDKHTNASNLGTTPTVLVGALAFTPANHEEFMQHLTTDEEMYVNRALAKEFITNHLDIKPTEQNIEALAQFIFQLEREQNNH